MSSIVQGRNTAEIDGDFVVFLIGMHINNLLAVHKWFPVATAMPKMITELLRQPELGLLSARTFWSGRILSMVQYWRSFDQLHAYAHARDKAHLPAWAEFNRTTLKNRVVGVYHETYMVSPGRFECVYVNTPALGLGLAGRTSPVTGRTNTARDRVTTQSPVQPESQAPAPAPEAHTGSPEPPATA